MSNNRIDHISAESIQDINGVKTWARDHEIRMNSKVSKIQTDISDLKDKDDLLQDRIARNTRLVMITVIVTSVTLCVIVILSAAVRVIPMIKDLF